MVFLKLDQSVLFESFFFTRTKKNDEFIFFLFPFFSFFSSNRQKNILRAGVSLQKALYGKTPGCEKQVLQKREKGQVQQGEVEEIFLRQAAATHFALYQAPVEVLSLSTNIEDASIVATVTPWKATRARIILCETFWLPYFWRVFFFQGRG